jgi:hypothetical protein
MVFNIILYLLQTSITLTYEAEHFNTSFPLEPVFTD